MAVVKTISADEPDKILKIDDGAVSHVWLRKNIVKDAADNGIDGMACEFWRADEVSFICPFIETAEIEKNFDSLFAKYSEDESNVSERLAALESAILEIGDIVGGE